MRVSDASPSLKGARVRVTRVALGPAGYTKDVGTLQGATGTVIDVSNPGREFAQMWIDYDSKPGTKLALCAEDEYEVISR